MRERRVRGLRVVIGFGQGCGMFVYVCVGCVGVQEVALNQEGAAGENIGGEERGVRREDWIRVTLLNVEGEVRKGRMSWVHESWPFEKVDVDEPSIPPRATQAGESVKSRERISNRQLQSNDAESIDCLLSQSLIEMRGM